jgi:ABC-type multidrug transport system ATPase subunit
MIALDGVTVRYGEGQPALTAISMDVGKGEVVAILGPNGAESRRSFGR